MAKRIVVALGGNALGKNLPEQMAAELKDMRADIKRTAEKLEKAHPESESIKHGFRLAFVG